MSSTPGAAPSSTGRLTSLDAFRGLTVAGMILVNNPGDGSHVYGPLEHATWHGFTPTDLVFPSFLFIAGVAIPLALGKRLARGDSTGQIVTKVVLRSLVIIVLGLLMAAFPYHGRDMATLRWPGVLQRIGICYLAASLIYLATPGRAHVWVIVGLLLAYWAAMTMIPVPGVGAGDLSRPNNLAAWLDRSLLGHHLYKSDYDPEGLLSTLPAVATTLIGVLAGRWLAGAGRSTAEKVAGIFAAGAVLTFLGASWNGSFPINKALWTSSFVLYAGGLSLTILGLCAWLIEIEGVKRWAWPFLALGSNAIAAYVLSGMLVGVLSQDWAKIAGPDGHKTSALRLIYHQVFANPDLARWISPYQSSLFYAVAYVLFWLVIVSVLYRFKIFIRV
jgi:predicted acyltransferase